MFLPGQRSAAHAPSRHFARRPHTKHSLRRSRDRRSAPGADSKYQKYQLESCRYNTNTNTTGTDIITHASPRHFARRPHSKHSLRRSRDC